nr:LysM peptidoglycan-binding domain-containing protein [uncultured Rothia sp.]
MPRTPRIFRPLFMRRIVLTLGGTAIGLGAVFAPAHAAEASHTPAPTAPTTSLMAPDACSAGYSTDGSSVAYQTEPTDAGNTTNAEIPLAPNTTESTGSLQDRSPFFAPSHEARGTYAYTVRAGDTLWSIAAEQLGEGTDASVIYDYTLDIYSANREALGRNADLLYEGQVLQIPEQPLQTFRR